MKKITTLDQLKKAVEGTKFAQDMTTSMSVNGRPMPHGYWNLVCSIRDCKLYSKGIKPTRHWKISDVKWYFGVSGSAEKIAETLEMYKNIILPEEKEAA
jgi:hypothetical protein